MDAVFDVRAPVTQVRADIVHHECILYCAFEQFATGRRLVQRFRAGMEGASQLCSADVA